MRKVLLVGALALAPLLAACGGDGGSGHSVVLGGVGHRDGNTDPLANCAGCHGAALRGGSGPGCYNCHTSADHVTTYRAGGVRHNAGVDCARCHGPSRTRGGLGPACVGAGCHAA